MLELEGLGDDKTDASRNLVLRSLFYFLGLARNAGDKMGTGHLPSTPEVAS